MRCQNCRNSLLRDGVTDIALITRRLVLNKATKVICAICATCKTPVPLPTALSKALSRALFVEVRR